MRLRIVTPLSVVIDEEGVLALRAEDATGSFGILPHHADFLTSLLFRWWAGKATTGHDITARCAAASSPCAAGRTSPLRHARRCLGMISQLWIRRSSLGFAPKSRTNGPNMSRTRACSSRDPTDYEPSSARPAHRCGNILVTAPVKHHHPRPRHGRTNRTRWSKRFGCVARATSAGCTRASPRSHAGWPKSACSAGSSLCPC